MKEGYYWLIYNTAAKPKIVWYYPDWIDGPAVAFVGNDEIVDLCDVNGKIGDLIEYTVNPVDIIEELIPVIYPGCTAETKSFDTARSALNGEFPISTTNFKNISIADIIESLDKLDIEDLRNIPAKIYNHETEEWETITGFMLDAAKLKFYAVSDKWMKKYCESLKPENTPL